jgi:hypothetical protein
MSPRLLYLLSAENAASCERHLTDAAAAGMPGRRRPRLPETELTLAA